MKIRISTDSTADIPVSLQQELDIRVLPLTIETAEGQEWLDGIEERLDYGHWYAGHYHTEKDIDKLSILFEGIREWK